MTKTLLRDFFLGFIRIHILYHATQEPIFGLEMIRELATHGYDLSPGTIYPILHKLEKRGYLVSEKRIIEGKMRKYYSTTPTGHAALAEAMEKVRELLDEIEIGSHQ